MFEMFKFAFRSPRLPSDSEAKVRGALKSVVAQRSHGNVRLQKGKYYTKEDTSAEYEQLKNRKFAGA